MTGSKLNHMFLNDVIKPCSQSHAADQHPSVRKHSYLVMSRLQPSSCSFRSNMWKKVSFKHQSAPWSDERNLSRNLWNLPPEEARKTLGQVLQAVRSSSVFSSTHHHRRSAEHSTNKLCWKHTRTPTLLTSWPSRGHWDLNPVVRLTRATWSCCWIQTLKEHKALTHTSLYFHLF